MVGEFFLQAPLGSFDRTLFLVTLDLPAALKVAPASSAASLAASPICHGSMPILSAAAAAARPAASIWSSREPPADLHALAPILPASTGGSRVRVWDMIAADREPWRRGTLARLLVGFLSAMSFLARCPDYLPFISRRFTRKDYKYSYKSRTCRNSRDENPGSGASCILLATIPRHGSLLSSEVPGGRLNRACTRLAAALGDVDHATTAAAVDRSAAFSISTVADRATPADSSTVADELSVISLATAARGAAAAA